MYRSATYEKNGVKDFVVWSFSAVHGNGPVRYRGRGTVDCCPSNSRCTPATCCR